MAPAHDDKLHKLIEAQTLFLTALREMQEDAPPRKPVTPETSPVIDFPRARTG